MGLCGGTLCVPAAVRTLPALAPSTGGIGSANLLEITAKALRKIA